MSPDHASFMQWWWLLIALLAVAMLMMLLRGWLSARKPAREPAPPEVVAPVLAAPLVPAAAKGADVQDPVTGLATRLSLEDQLAAAVMRAEARQRRLALLYIDLDGFKPINDALGHASGDALLREVGQRLSRMGRATDTVARMGSDEFLMLLDGDPDSASAALVADRVRHHLQLPYAVQGREVRLSCSIGIVMFPDHGPRGKLIARADAAMMAAKHAGGNMHCFFEDSMDLNAQVVIDLQRELRHAIETQSGLCLHYQPKVASRNGQITGVEALVRWQHPERGLLLPADFLPVAERFGLVAALGQWVTEEACRQVRVWQAQGLNMRVAINLSGHQLRQADLVEKTRDALTHYQVLPELFSFEVSETAAMEDAKSSLRVFERLSQLGVSLSIDDLGTGYSSLSYLRKLPLSQLKIDRSFVQGVDKEEDAKAIVRAVIKLAHALGLEVVAEGVETEAQQRMLMRLGCDQMQGYFLARPMPADHVQQWLTGDELPARRSSFQASEFKRDERDQEPGSSIQ